VIACLALLNDSSSITFLLSNKSFRVMSRNDFFTSLVTDSHCFRLDEYSDPSN
jgi:hypothetical protein